jgi:hypothetical protein
VTQEQALAAVVSLLANQTLRPESLFALAQAAQVVETEGVSGTLVVKIPRKKTAPVDVQFTTGPAKIELEL